MRPRTPPGQHGKISARKTETGQWVARTYYRDQYGKRRDVTARATTKAAAQRRLTAKLENLTNHGATITTLREALESWLGQHRVAPQTKPTYTAAVERVSKDIGNLQVHELSTPMLYRYITELDAKPTTVSTCRRVLKMALDREVINGTIATNPMSLVPATPAARKIPKALTAEQIIELRQYLANSCENRAWLPLLVDFLLATGARVGEALGIRWQDIDFETRQCTIRGTVVDRTKSWQAHTKTGHARAVILPAGIIDALSSVPRVSEFVFVGARGGLLTGANAGTVLRNVLRGSSWEWITFHTFRRTVATLIDRAAGSNAASVQLGHEKDSMTRRSYIERRGIADNSAVLQEALYGESL